MFGANTFGTSNFAAPLQKTKVTKQLNVSFSSKGCSSAQLSIKFETDTDTNPSYGEPVSISKPINIIKV